MHYLKTRFKSGLTAILALLIVFSSVSFPAPLMAAGELITKVTVDGKDYTDPSGGIDYPAVTSLKSSFAAACSVTASYPKYKLRLLINDPGRGEYSQTTTEFTKPASGNVTKSFSDYTFSQPNTTYPIEYTLIGIDNEGEESDLHTVAFDMSIGNLDTTAPQLALGSCIPGQGATKVPINSNIEVAFSEEISISSVSPSNLYLTVSGSSTKVSADYSVVNGNKVIIDPTSNLAYSTTYKVTVAAGGIKDLAGNAAAAASYTFTTDGDPNAAAKIDGRIPASGATNVARNTDVTVTFDKELDLTASDFGSAGIALKKGTTVVAASVIPINAGGRCEITLDPTADLDYGTVYTVAIGGSKLKDEKGRYVAATSWTFTTEGSPVASITGRSPGEKESGVKLDEPIKITFSKAVNTSTLSSSTVYLRKSGSTTKISANLTYASSTRTVTLKPTADLAPSTTYYVYITSSLKDTTGTSYVSSTESWYFTTSADYVRVTEKSPDDGAANVPIDTKITFKFSAAMKASTVKSTNIYLRRYGYTSKVSAAVEYNSSTRVVTLTPSANLRYGEEYVVTVTDGVEDASGDWIEEQTWSFTTMDDDYPHVIRRYPAAGTTAFPADGTIEIEFSTAMKASTINTTNIYLRKAGSSTKISADVEYDSSDRTATLKPRSDLAYGTEYTVYVTDNVQERYGDPIIASEWSFKTAPEKAKASSLDPADGATKVPVGKTITFKFSKAMNSGTISSTNIYLKEAGSSAKTAATVSYASSTRTVTVKPQNSLKYGTKYYLYITDGVKDSDGYAVDEATYSFTTEAEALRRGTATRPLVRINGSYVVFTDVYPYITTGRTMIPFRALFEAIGAYVDYDTSNPARQKITAKLGNNTIVLYIGDKTAYKNGVKVTLDVAPEILNSRTMIPLRFCGEALGAYVDYDGINYVVIIEQNG